MNSTHPARAAIQLALNGIYHGDDVVDSRTIGFGVGRSRRSDRWYAPETGAEKKDVH